MKKQILFLSLLLAACGSQTVTPTVDPYLAAAHAERTAAAAQQDAAYYGSQLTATAQAPLVAITQTAAAFEMQQEYAAATSQSARMTETASITGTARSWTATPNATSTMVAAQVVAQQTMVANDIERDNLQLESTRSTNFLLSMSPYIAGMLGLLVAVMIGVGFARKISAVAIPVDARGNPQPMIMDGIAFDIDRAPNGMMGIDSKYMKQLPALTAERQDAVTNRDQLIDLRTRSTVIGRLPKALPESTLAKVQQAEALALPDRLFPLPSWELLDDYKGEKEIPYGLSAQGLMRVNIDKHPHIAVIGKTGAGKSRRFLRPFLACALKSGRQVIVIGEQVDFWPLATHPNAILVPVNELTRESDASQYTHLLQMIVEEMNRRWDTLTSRQQSMWSLNGGDNTLVVLDELGVALELMPREYAETAKRLLGSLVKKGRKAGFNIVFTSQRAVGLRDLMTQVGRVIFAVEDKQETRHALGGDFGAEDLQDGYFLSKFGSIQLTGSFEPTDGQLIEFLQRRQVKTLERPTWIDGAIQPIDAKQFPGTPDAERLPASEPSTEAISVSRPEYSDEVIRMAESIRGQWSAELSKSKVSLMLGKPYGGSTWTVKVNEVVRYLTATTTSTGEKSPKAPEMGLMPA